MVLHNGVSKSDMIRDVAKENSGAGPTVLAQKIKEKYGVEVSTAMVSTVISKTKAGTQPGKVGRPLKQGNPEQAPAPQQPAPARDLSIDAILDMKRLVDAMGGFDQARKAMEALGKILA